MVPAVPAVPAVLPGSVQDDILHHPVAMVDPERCIGCGICVAVCPEQAISVDAMAVVEPARCSGCGACIPECPGEALSLGTTLQATAVVRRRARE